MVALIRHYSSTPSAVGSAICSATASLAVGKVSWIDVLSPTAFPCAVTATIAAVSMSTASSALIGQFCATILQARDLGFRFMGLIQSSLDAFLLRRRSTASRRRFIGGFPPFTFRQLLQVIRVALLHVAPHDGLHPRLASSVVASILTVPLQQSGLRRLAQHS